LKPVLAAAFAAVIWGIWWVPVRYLETLGLHGAWGGLVMMSGAALLAIIVLFATGRGLRLNRNAMIGAACVGVAVSTYSTALNYSEVIRVVLLFYLAPAWSKLIEWRFLRIPWHWSSTLAIIAALLGAFLVLGGKISGAALNGGDLLAILSGMAWAAGASLVFSGGKPSALSLTTITSIASVLVALPFALSSGLPTIISPTATLTSAVGFGAIYVVPIMVMTLWAAQRLSPATITFLLSAEILSGVISGAVFLDEPFGMLQVAGTVLIILAATSEVLVGLRRTAKTI